MSIRHKYKIAAFAIISLSFFVGVSYALEGEQIDKLRQKEIEHKCKVLKALQEDNTDDAKLKAQREQELKAINADGDASWKAKCK